MGLSLKGFEFYRAPFPNLNTEESPGIFLERLDSHSEALRRGLRLLRCGPSPGQGPPVKEPRSTDDERERERENRRFTRASCVHRIFHNHATLDTAPFLSSGAGSVNQNPPKAKDARERGLPGTDGPVPSRTTELQRF